MTDNDEPTRASDDSLASSTVDSRVKAWLEGYLRERLLELPEPEEVHRYDDNDSAIGIEGSSASSVSSTASVSSSIRDYRTINGRTYHSRRWDHEYWGPTDKRQIESLVLYDLAFWTLLDGSLHLAPLKAGIKRALDIGTGRGDWAIDFADEYPDAEVIGTDISPIQTRSVPDNLCFEIDDCTQPWTWGAESFDYVHIRWLGGSVEDWTSLYAQAYRCVKQGAFLESHEPSFQFRSDHKSVKPGSALEELGETFAEAGKKTGCSFTIADDGTQKKSMQEAGFTIVEEKRLKMPIRGWPKDPKLKELGWIALGAFQWDLVGYLLYVTTQVLSRGKDEAHDLARRVLLQLEEERMYVYVEHNVVVGQKPQSPSDSHV